MGGYCLIERQFRIRNSLNISGLARAKTFESYIRIVSFETGFVDTLTKSWPHFCELIPAHSFVFFSKSVVQGYFSDIPRFEVSFFITARRIIQ
jgi:hypothetical protein